MVGARDSDDRPLQGVRAALRHSTGVGAKATMITMQAFQRTTGRALLMGALIAAANCRGPDLIAPPETLQIQPELAVLPQLGRSTGTLTGTESSCLFMTVDGGWDGVCDAYAIAVTSPGILEADVRWAADAPLVAFLKSTSGRQIEISCCGTPLTLRAPVQPGAYRLEIVYVGRPPGYPRIGKVDYEVSTRVVQPGPEDSANVRVILLADAARTQRLAVGRIEVIDGPFAGRVAAFDPATGTYDIAGLIYGYTRLLVSADRFRADTVTVPVGVSVSQEVVLTRLVPLSGADHTLGGMTWATHNTAYDDAKIEILDGPQAGIFTFSEPEWGFYRLEGLAGGTIRVRASREGVTSITQTVRVSGRTLLDFRW
jgi:hypothetical protein